MKREFLKELGVADELIDKIMNENGQDIEKAKGELTTVQSELKTVKEQLQSANSEIQKYKTMDIEEIKKSADDYKTKFEESEKKAQEEIKKMQLDYKIENLLLKEGAVNTKAVKALLDSSKISLDGDNIVGLDDQLTTIKESEPWAFNAQPTVRTKLPGGGPGEKLSGVESRFYEKNPDLKPE